jgi:chromosome segregation ATPase
MTERWTDERLDRLALTVESNNEQIAANSQAIAANVGAIASSDGRLTRMESAITELSQMQLRMAQEFADYRRDMTEMRADFRETANTQTQILGRIDEMQAEVRGLQTENRRILDRVFGEPSN